MAFHGSPNCLHIGEKIKLKLLDPNPNAKDFAKIIAGSDKGKIIHFGSCSTLNMSAEEIAAFRKQTGATAISGYNEDIDFIESTLLDILFFMACQNFIRPSAIDKYMKDNYSGFHDRTGFKFHY